MGAAAVVAGAFRPSWCGIGVGLGEVREIVLRNGGLGVHGEIAGEYQHECQHLGRGRKSERTSKESLGVEDFVNIIGGTNSAGLGSFD